jgi:uncharacterized repeat protein (TIGR04042 family)
MPEMHFVVRWPDGLQMRCYSPSLVVRDYLQEGKSYCIADFLQRSRAMLEIASERVRARYGFACSAALDQLAELEACAAERDPAALVEVVGFELPPGLQSAP